MRPMISHKTVSLFLRQNYNLTSKQFVEEKIMQPKIIPELIREFTGCEVHNEKLTFCNPYTNQQETLGYYEYSSIDSFSNLMEQLVEVHKTRMNHLEQSHSKANELAKSEKVKSTGQSQRIAELEELSQEELDEELER